MLRIAILALGAAAGFGYGYQTRPSLLGVQVPLDVIGSSHPMDASFKSDLIAHLSVSTGIGFAIALAVVLLLNVVGKKNEVA